MNEAYIKEALAAAREFVRRADDLLKDPNRDWKIIGTAKSAAVRRQSMELTRALAEFRR